MSPADVLHAMNKDLQLLMNTIRTERPSIEQLQDAVAACDRMVPNMQKVRAEMLATYGVDVNYDIPNQRTLIVPVTPETA